MSANKLPNMHESVVRAVCLALEWDVDSSLDYTIAAEVARAVLAADHAETMAEFDRSHAAGQTLSVVWLCRNCRTPCPDDEDPREGGRLTGPTARYRVGNHNPHLLYRGTARRADDEEFLAACLTPAIAAELAALLNRETDCE